MLSNMSSRFVRVNRELNNDPVSRYLYVKGTTYAQCRAVSNVGVGWRVATDGYQSVSQREQQASEAGQVLLSCESQVQDAVVCESIQLGCGEVSGSVIRPPWETFVRCGLQSYRFGVRVQLTSCPVAMMLLV